ncbi:membrane protein [Corynebacterium phage Adelaide]|uniref:Uncharacterized protein n=1 Tax=Corynebacterium phage Adelaide TaxID=2588499 RepID=A0A514DKL5_9CAUD|nr:membrane protein [Corynebacterium phage Adelaide]QDH94145.1 hypothetical protein SEA_ADELAIDE_24 [Corynebacterium phage Adelaide]
MCWLALVFALGEDLAAGDHAADLVGALVDLGDLLGGVRWAGWILFLLVDGHCLMLLGLLGLLFLLGSQG